MSPIRKMSVKISANFRASLSYGTHPRHFQLPCCVGMTLTDTGVADINTCNRCLTRRRVPTVVLPHPLHNFVNATTINTANVRQNFICGYPILWTSYMNFCFLRNAEEECRVQQRRPFPFFQCSQESIVSISSLSLGVTFRSV